MLGKEVVSTHWIQISTILFCNAKEAIFFLKNYIKVLGEGSRDNIANNGFIFWLFDPEESQKSHLREGLWGGKWCCHSARSLDSCHLASVCALAGGLSLPPLAYTEFCYCPNRRAISFPLPLFNCLGGKDEISVNLFTASFVFCGVVKLKTTFTNILMIKRAWEISITSPKAVCIKEKWYVISKRTFVLE